MKQLKISKTITDHDDVIFQKYLNEIGKFDLISPEEEVELAQRIKQGDQQAIEKLTKANLRFVVSVAKQYKGQGIPVKELVNEGNIGLIKAAQKFDETRGFKFISYAVRWIRQSILQAIAQKGRFVRLPLNKIGSINKIDKAQENFFGQNNRYATSEELSNILNISIDDIHEMQQISVSIVGLQSPLSGTPDNTTLFDSLKSNNPSPDTILIHESIQKELFNIMSCLNQTEKTVLIMFFGLNETTALSLDEIGEFFGKTRERARKTKEHAIRKLRRHSKSKNLKMMLS